MPIKAATIISWIMLQANEPGPHVKSKARALKEPYNDDPEAFMQAVILLAQQVAAKPRFADPKTAEDPGPCEDSKSAYIRFCQQVAIDYALDDVRQMTNPKAIIAVLEHHLAVYKYGEKDEE